MHRRTSLSLLILALLVGACGSESGPSVATLDQMRVVKVSGDQASPVPDAAPSATIYATAGASLQVAPGDAWTVKPLVARVEVQGSGSMGIMSGGPVVPAGTMIHWDLPEVAGKLRGLTTATDDSAHIVNRWAPGTKAGTYVASAHRILADGTITDDAEWELVVEPGAPADVQWGGGTWLCAGDEINLLDLVVYLYDAHRNKIDPEAGAAALAAALRWQWADRVQNSSATGPFGSGATVAVPDLGAYGFRPLTQTGYFGAPDRTYYAGGVLTWVGDRDTRYAFASQVYAPGHCPR